MTETQAPKTALQLLREITAHPDVFSVRLGVHEHENREAWVVFVFWLDHRPDTVIRRDDRGPLEMLQDIKRILDIGAMLDDMGNPHAR